MTTTCVCTLDDVITSLLKKKDTQEYRDWLNARGKAAALPVENPCFIYIQKGKKALSPCHALLKSIKREHYQDINYYVNKLLLDGVPAEEILKALRGLEKERVYATIYDEIKVACMQRLAGDPGLKALALSDTVTLKEMNAYIKARLTPEESKHFIGDTLTPEMFEEAKKTLIKEIAPCRPIHKKRKPLKLKVIA